MVRVRVTVMATVREKVKVIDKMKLLTTGEQVLFYRKHQRQHYQDTHTGSLQVLRDRDVYTNR